SMVVSAVEAIKIIVSAGMGVSLVPSISVARPGGDFVVRPIYPALTRTLGLIQHRNKPDDLALRTVRRTLMELSNIAGNQTAA
ncbi:MAG TPA: LysR family transcriptional regulator substrate-binding protein, partial [Gammaproteobacteria bacterium]|nr:LysR family transcriptional regulator substrate-binding protein [Gammaproteobacteria bacterium]